MKAKNKKKIKELKHQVNFWRNSNQGNYDRWKEANYERLKQLKIIDELEAQLKTRNFIVLKQAEHLARLQNTL